MAFTAEDVSTIQDVMSGKQPQAQDPAPAPAADPSSNGQATPESPAADPATPPAPAQNPVTPPTSDPIDLTKLGVKDFAELQEKWNKLPEYERKLAELEEYKAVPKFKSDRSKFIYDLAERSEGMELSSVRQLLDVVELLENKDAPDQHVRFEAFKLRPENKNLSQDEIRSLFTAEETERFGNSLDEENPPTEIQKIRAKQATAQARETLGKLKSDWDSTRPVHKSPEDIAREGQEYRQFLQKQLQGFDGIQGIKLSASDSKGEKLEGAINFKIDPDTQLSAITEAIADPQGMWESVLEEFGVTAPGKEEMDFKKFGELVTLLKFRNDLLNQAYQQGASDLEAAKLKGARNVSDPATGGGTPPAPPALSERSESAKEFLKVVGRV